MKDHPDERPPWQDHPDEIECPPWWETTLMKDHPDERPPWQDHPDEIESPPWWKTTLMRDCHDERPPWLKTNPCLIALLHKLFLSCFFCKQEAQLNPHEQSKMKQNNSRKGNREERRKWSSHAAMSVSPDRSDRKLCLRFSTRRKRGFCCTASHTRPACWWCGALPLGFLPVECTHSKVRSGVRKKKEKKNPAVFHLISGLVYIFFKSK